MLVWGIYPFFLEGFLPVFFFSFLGSLGPPFCWSGSDGIRLDFSPVFARRIDQTTQSEIENKRMILTGMGFYRENTR